jgi:type V secretory pathway adhesin AidA
VPVDEEAADRDDEATRSLDSAMPPSDTAPPVYVAFDATVAAAASASTVRGKRNASAAATTANNFFFMRAFRAKEKPPRWAAWKEVDAV